MEKFEFPEFSDEVVTFFYSVYKNNPENLKVVGSRLLKEKGLGYMQILLLTMKELKLGLGRRRGYWKCLTI
jgi:hypothetical protein